MMINRKNLNKWRVEVSFNRYRSIQGRLGTVLPENVILGSHNSTSSCHIVLLALNCYVWGTS